MVRVDKTHGINLQLSIVIGNGNLTSKFPSRHTVISDGQCVVKTSCFSMLARSWAEISFGNAYVCVILAEHVSKNTRLFGGTQCGSDKLWNVSVVSETYHRERAVQRCKASKHTPSVANKSHRCRWNASMAGKSICCQALLMLTSRRLNPPLSVLVTSRIRNVIVGK